MRANTNPVSFGRPAGPAGAGSEPGDPTLPRTSRPAVEISHGPRSAEAVGYRTSLSYDVDPRDYADPGAAAVRNRTLAAIRPGSVVSLHLGHAGTVAALPAILAGLLNQGRRAVAVSGLLGDGRP